MTSRRLDNVDGLRGIAALAVVIGHWCEFISGRAADASVRTALKACFLDYFSAGRFGVVAFFCISGFVVPFSFRGNNPLRFFLISRFFRLYPAYWLSLITAVFILPYVGYKYSLNQIFANATMLQSYLHQKDVLGVYWTLAIEIVFYAICFCLFAAKKLHGATANFCAIALFSAVAVTIGIYRFSHPHTNLPLGLPTYLAAMHFGNLARLYFFEVNQKAKSFYRVGIVILLAAALLANTVGYYHASDKVVGWVAADTGFMSGVLAFLFVVHTGSLSRSPFPMLGRISYSLYLFHPIVLDFCEVAWASARGSTLLVVALTAAMILSSILLASLVFSVVEKPAVRFGRALDDYLSQRIKPGGC